MSTPAQTATHSIYEAVTNLAYALKDATVQTAQWGARTCQTGFHHASALALKIMDFIRPHLCAARKFAVENPKLMLAGFGCAVAGSLLTQLFMAKAHGKAKA